MGGKITSYRNPHFAEVWTLCFLVVLNSDVKYVFTSSDVMTCMNGYGAIDAGGRLLTPVTDDGKLTATSTGLVAPRPGLANPFFSAYQHGDGSELELFGYVDEQLKLVPAV
jgi:hypothetical protein